MIDSLLDEMCKSVGKDVAVYQEYVLKEKKIKNSVCYFIEGKDFEYYQPRVKNIANNKKVEMCWHLACDGKKNVIGVRELLNNATFDESNKRLFFVDRDYDFDDIPVDICKTDYYSIENYYLNENVVLNALENVLGVNCINNNFILAMKYYKDIYNKYSDFAVKMNAFFYSVRKKEKESGYPRTDLNKRGLTFFIENEELNNFKFKEVSYEELIRIYDVKFEMDIDEIQVNEEIFDVNNHWNFRGKFELDLLKWFLEKVKNGIKNEKYDFEKEKYIRRINFCESTMFLLSKYAYTPEILKEYIEEYT